MGTSSAAIGAGDVPIDGGEGSRSARVATGGTWRRPDTGAAPEGAFDALYAHTASGLTRQTYLLTGRRSLAFESVDWAFRQAWQNWPEVAADPDPVSWVRCKAHEYALSPWHRFRWTLRDFDASVTDATHRTLLDLPAPQRRALLLCEGLGLAPEQAAWEMEASTPATTSRLLWARDHMAHRLLGLEDPAAVSDQLRTMVADTAVATLPLARSIRLGSEERVRHLTWTVFAMMAAFICLIALFIATTPDR
ncbi:RNA polymerase subunit sigma-70 [Streptomyces sp. V2I9]|uniref:RNA polymerase subunit sigma-70 n=1 Tax=Streptomyces sp. V2I9 TaxID=3042304 RepID=UPI00277F6F78|nr:RNA polymerase subunit sigma-70 [Streptomyces sp. V2I9]MDQ0988303.1 DNA-directed RNA polymerase specialized sigma24 family protein [Streptomyces sp. V2I9]